MANVFAKSSCGLCRIPIGRLSPPCSLTPPPVIPFNAYIREKVLPSIVIMPPPYPTNTFPQPTADEIWVHVNYQSIANGDPVDKCEMDHIGPATTTESHDAAFASAAGETCTQLIGKTLNFDATGHLVSVGSSDMTGCGKTCTAEGGCA